MKANTKKTTLYHLADWREEEDRDPGDPASLALSLEHGETQIFLTTKDGRGIGIELEGGALRAFIFEGGENARETPVSITVPEAGDIIVNMQDYQREVPDAGL